MSLFWNRWFDQEASTARKQKRGKSCLRYVRIELEQLETRINPNTTLSPSSGGLQILIAGADSVSLSTASGDLIVTDITAGQGIADSTGKFTITGTPGNEVATEDSSLAGDFTSITVTGTSGGQTVNFLGGSFVTTNVNDGTISTVAFNGGPSYFSGDLNVVCVSPATVSAPLTASGSVAITTSGHNAALDVNADITCQTGSLDLQATGDVVIGNSVTLLSPSGSISLGADLTPAGTGDDGIGTLTISSGASVFGVHISLRGADEDIASTAVVGRATASPDTLVANLTPSNSLLRPGALTFDTAGNLYVASWDANIVSKFTPGATTSSATLSGLNVPQAVAVDNGGTVYVGNYGNNSVSEFAPGGLTPTATLTGIPDPVALAIDSAGNLFVASFSYASGAVFEFAPGTTSPMATLSGIPEPQALAFDSAGNLYVASYAAGIVKEFAPGASTAQATLTGLTTPFAMAFDGAGNLYVANSGGNTVSEFAPGATTPTATLTGLSQPQALAFDSLGNLYVANADNNTVSKFSPGALTPGLTLTGANDATALAVDAANNVYVGNMADQFVRKYVPGATTPTVNLTGLSYPKAEVLDGAGNLYVANYGGGTVSKFAPGATSVTATLTGLTNPVALAVDHAGDLYVANSTANTVSIFAPGATSPTATINGLDNPDALAVDGSGNLYVANAYGLDITKYAPGSTSPSATLSVADDPTVLAIDGSGTLYAAIVDKIDVFPPGATSPSATLTGARQVGGLAFDSAGNVYASSENVVYEYSHGATTPSATLSGMLTDPEALAFDANGNLYVANFDGQTAVVFPPGATAPSAVLGGLSSPDAFVFDKDNNLYIANYYGSVSKFAPLGIPATATITVHSSLSTRPMSIGGTNNAMVSGINLVNAELARMITSSTGTVTFGDSNQAGDVVFTAVTPATTSGAATTVLQSGAGEILLDDAASTTAALNGNGGTITLIAGAGGILGATTNLNGTPDLYNATTVSLSSAGDIASAAQPLVLDTTTLDTDTSSSNGDQFLSALHLIVAANVNAGSGTVTLSGPGTFEADGVIESAVTVASGTLIGNGTTGPVTVKSATLQPGDAPGDLHTGNLLLTSDANFSAQIGGTVPGAKYSQDIVTGTVNLGSATLAVQFLNGFAPTANQAFILIDNDGADPVTGTFAGLAEGGLISIAGKTYHITYIGGDGNDVALVFDSPVVLTTPTLANGVVGAAYNQAIGVSGGSGGWVFNSSPSSLPPGLMLSTNGVLSGVPTTAGNYTFTVAATDSVGDVGTQTYTVSIFAFTPSVLPAWTKGQPGYSQTIAVSGGMSPYTFTTTGPLPPGLTLASGGILSGTPTTSGSYSFAITATDALGIHASLIYTLQIQPVVAITSSGLPAWTVNQPGYAAAIATSGGTAPITFALSSGALPNGLTLSSAGVVTGTPTKNGNYTFTVKATDSVGASASKSLAIFVSTAVSITTTSLPNWTINQAGYSKTIIASGGTGAKVFTATGSVPPGLAIGSSSGVVSGTPTAAGNFMFTVTVTDATGANASVAYTVIINPQLAITTTSLASWTINKSGYTQTIKTTGGTGTLTFSSPTNGFPFGISLSSAGVLSGTPATLGTYSFTIAVTDSIGARASSTFILIINPALTISPASLQNWTVNQPGYSQTITTSGGTAPVSLTETGTLPTGLTLVNGVLSGEPTTAGTYSFTVKATDSVGASVSQDYTVYIDVPPTILTAALAGWTANEPGYSQQIVTQNGTAPYTFSESGDFPPWVTLAKNYANGAVLRGIPTSAGTFAFTVTMVDAAGASTSKTYTLIINPPLTFPLSSLTNWTLNQPAYDQTVSTTGGTGAIAFTATGTLPPGISLLPSGVLVGTPTVAGTYSFTVTATDSLATGSLPGSAYLLLDDPLALGDGTMIHAISGNNLVGEYQDSSNHTHAFLYDGSAYTTIDPPSAMPSDLTRAVGVSGSTVVGQYLDTSSVLQTFLYNGTSWNTVNYPSLPAGTATPTGIAGSLIVGYYLGSSTENGYWYDGTTLVTLDDPLATTGTVANGIWGTTIVGNYGDSVGDHGFLYNGSSYTTLDVPFGTPGSTGLTGISSSGITGFYSSSGVRYQFLYSGTTYTKLSPPPGTLIVSGSFPGGYVGYTIDGTGYHGFYYVSNASVLSEPSIATRSYTITINPTLSFVTSSLPGWTVNAGGYGQTLNVSGGTGSVTFRASGTLPGGLTLSPGGVLSGTPTRVGSYAFTVTATDASGASASENYTVTIFPGAFSQYLVTIGGSGTAPAGTGLPVAVQAADAYGNPVTSYTASATVTINVSPATVGTTFPTSVAINSSGLGLFLASFQQVGSYTINAGAGSFSGSSAPVSVTAGPAVKLGFVAQPVDTPTGVTLPPISVQLQDPYGNPVTSDNTDTVTLGVASGPPGAPGFAAGSSTTAVFHNGLATFANLILAAPGSYTLSELVPTLFTGPNSISFNVLPLQVVLASVVDSASGFSLQFNAPYLVDSLTPVLYGRGFGAGAPVPSVTLTQIKDEIGNPITPVPVAGSLVLSSGDRGQGPGASRLTFVATNTSLEADNGSPILPDGTYQVVVHGSAATDGFQAFNPGGGFLDGLGTGTAGSGDFTTTFTVNAAASHDDVVWAPATADGPGQPLSAPGANQTGGGYPIYLDDSTGTVTSVQLTLNYNPSLLTVTGVSGAGFSLLPSSSAGQADLQYSGPALPTGSQRPIGYLLATVPAGTAAVPTPYRAKDLLHFSGVSLNGGAVPVTTNDPLHLAAYVGDADGNGSYSSSDALLLTRAALEQDSGFAAYPLVDPVIVGDVDGTGYIPPDAGLQVNEAGVNVATSNLPSPPIPSGVQFQVIGNNVDPTLSLEVRSQRPEVGTAGVTVAVNIDDADPAGSSGLIEGHLALRYDPRQFSVSAADVHLGSLLSSGGWSVTTTINAVTGEIAIALSGTTPISTSVGGSLVTIDFHPVRRIDNPPYNAIAMVGSATELEDAQGAFTLTFANDYSPLALPKPRLPALVPRTLLDRVFALATSAGAAYSLP